MSRFRVARRALRDIDAIADYTLATWGESQTLAYVSELEGRFQWLADHPRSGRARPEIQDGYRSYPHGTHVIFYIVEPRRYSDHRRAPRLDGHRCLFREAGVSA